MEQQRGRLMVHSFPHFRFDYDAIVEFSRHHVVNRDIIVYSCGCRDLQKFCTKPFAPSDGVNDGSFGHIWVFKVRSDRYLLSTMK